MFSPPARRQDAPHRNKGEMCLLAHFRFFFPQVHLNEQRVSGSKKKKRQCWLWLWVRLYTFWHMVTCRPLPLHNPWWKEVQYGSFSHTHTPSRWPHWQIATGHSRATAGRSFVLEYTQKMRRNGRNRCMANYSIHGQMRYQRRKALTVKHRNMFECWLITAINCRREVIYHYSHCLIIIHVVHTLF